MALRDFLQVNPKIFSIFWKVESLSDFAESEALHFFQKILQATNDCPSLGRCWLHASAFLLHPALALGTLSAASFVALRIGWIQAKLFCVMLTCSQYYLCYVWCLLQPADCGAWCSQRMVEY